VLRHAKSSWDDSALRDFDRPLTRRGARAAAQMAALLAEAASPPTRALCSAARRTQDTLAAVRARLGLHCEIEESLYLADAASLLARLARIEDGETSVLVVGHNPGLHDLAVALAGSGKPKALRRLAERFPTGAHAELAIGSRWNDLAPGCARLVGLTFPRDLE
jgi:phosphohistidine phosphatase